MELKQLILGFAVLLASFGQVADVYGGGGHRKTLQDLTRTIDSRPGELNSFIHNDQGSWMDGTSAVAALSESLQKKFSWIEPCCKTIQPSKDFFSQRSGAPVVAREVVPVVIKDSDDQDPYITGPHELKLTRTPYSFGSADYSYAPPASLGNAMQIATRLKYQISFEEKTENLQQYYDRRLGQVLKLSKAKDIEAVTTKVGEGALSRVFMLHPPVPKDADLISSVPGGMDLSQRYPEKSRLEASRLYWVANYSHEVIKVVTPTPFESDIEESARNTRREIALHEVFEACANAFYVVNEDGKKEPLVQGSRYTQSQEELQSGIFRQATVNGDSAYRIAVLIEQARAGDIKAEQYLIENLNFTGVQDAEKKIRLLEVFYAETHLAVLQFEKENKLPIMISPVKHPHTGGVVDVMVGFDFNLGRNVLWDPAIKRFKMIDY